MDVSNPPLPHIEFESTDPVGDGTVLYHIVLRIVNAVQLPSVLFQDAPERGPCPNQVSSSRTWIRRIDPGTGETIFSKCNFSGKVPFLFDFYVFANDFYQQYQIELWDRKLDQTYKSNVIEIFYIE